MSAGEKFNSWLLVIIKVMIFGLRKHIKYILVIDFCILFLVMFFVFNLFADKSGLGVVYAATYSVTNTADSGADSLRQAILDANAGNGADLISFNIPITDVGCIDPDGGGLGACNDGNNDSTGDEYWSIHPLSPLPVINDTTGGTIIDGYTQTGAVKNTNPKGALNSVLKVEIRGLGFSVPGYYIFQIYSADNTIQGMAINSGVLGVRISSFTALNNHIAGNYIGTDIFGNFAVKNQGGVALSNNVDNNIIGMDGDGNNDAAERNLISGNIIGVSIYGSSNDNKVSGNLIGINKNGIASLSNEHIGVYVNELSSGTIIGTDGDGIADDIEGNVISANGTGGTSVSHTGILIAKGSGNRVAGNLIGLDVFGTSALPNFEGITITTPGNIIGTNSDGVSDDLERNIISGNMNGIYIYGGGYNTIVAGNYIGTDSDGMSAIPNLQYGVVIGSSSVSNSRIGTNSDGVNDNSERNIISGNIFGGVFLRKGSDNTVVSGNYIGVASDGVSPLPNDKGLYLQDCSSVLVGGVNNPVSANIIANNLSFGVFIKSTVVPTLNNSLRGNFIYNNGQLGIDIFPLGVNLNDVGDLDVGVNNLLNFPVITGIQQVSPTVFRLSGTLDIDTDPTLAVVDVYVSDQDASGYGEGKTYLNGTSPFVGGAWSVDITPGTERWFTSSTVDLNGNTSEFSASFQLLASQIDQSPTVSTELLVDSRINPENLTNPQPFLSAIFHDPDIGESTDKYQIQVDDNSDFSSPFWDSGSTGTVMPVCPEGSRCSIIYGGNGLGKDKVYYWRIKFFDLVGEPSPWSTDTAFFKIIVSGGRRLPTAVFPPEIYDTDVITSSSIKWLVRNIYGQPEGYRLKDAAQNLIMSVPYNNFIIESDLEANTFYQRTISSFSQAFGESLPSNIWSAGTLSQIPPAPELVSLTSQMVKVKIPNMAGFRAGNNLSSYSGEDLSAYLFEEKNTNKQSGWIKENTYSFLDLLPNQKYNIHVKARNFVGKETDFSKTFTITTLEYNNQNSCGQTIEYVCGNNGSTYMNECFARIVGVGVAYQGECVLEEIICTKTVKKVCGLDGLTYNNECLAEKFGTRVDYLGECRVEAQPCPDLYIPVCGDDGKNYRNTCFAEKAGIKTAYQGNCQEDTVEQEICPEVVDYVCSEDGKIYQNDCFLRKDNRVLDYRGKCIQETVDLCIDKIDYVCGKDGVTYQNKCFAQKAGVRVGYAGQCRQDNVCPSLVHYVCGQNGITYGNLCYLEKDGVEMKYWGVCRNKSWQIKPDKQDKGSFETSLDIGEELLPINITGAITQDVGGIQINGKTEPGLGVFVYINKYARYQTQSNFEGEWSLFVPNIDFTRERGVKLNYLVEASVRKMQVVGGVLSKESPRVFLGQVEVFIPPEGRTNIKVTSITNTGWGVKNILDNLIVYEQKNKYKQRVVLVGFGFVMLLGIPVMYGNIFYLSLFLLTLFERLLSLFGLKRKQRSWGKVFDGMVKDTIPMERMSFFVQLIHLFCVGIYLIVSLFIKLALLAALVLMITNPTVLNVIIFMLYVLLICLERSLLISQKKHNL